MPTSNTNEIENQLREALKSDGRSIRAIANEADISHTVVSKFISGGDIRLSSAVALARAIGREFRLSRS
jgi:hypothetical protein